MEFKEGSWKVMEKQKVLGNKRGKNIKKITETSETGLNFSRNRLKPYAVMLENS